MAERSNYKWTLRRGGKKLRCPQCGQMRFVPYVSSLDRRTLAGEEYGRCDREQSCGYHRYPGQEVTTPDVEYVPEPKEEPVRFSPLAVATDPRTNLFKWAARLLGMTTALMAWARYKVGNDHGRAIFWQIDKDGIVHGGKSIPYLANGHRDKSDRRPASWLHKSREWDLYRTGTKLEQCFFGEHLLAQYPEDKVAIVESEKTAVIMSAVSKGFVWLACGGSQGLKNEERCKVLEGRKVFLVPDHGQYYAWLAIANKYGWEITPAIEQRPVFEGCDILDLLEAGSLGKINKK